MLHACTHAHGNYIWDLYVLHECNSTCALLLLYYCSSNLSASYIFHQLKLLHHAHAVAAYNIVHVDA